jgi:hypothetical protein
MMLSLVQLHLLNENRPTNSRSDTYVGRSGNVFRYPLYSIIAIYCRMPSDNHIHKTTYKT